MTRWRQCCASLNYEEIMRELKRVLIRECRCNGRLKAEAEGSTQCTHILGHGAMVEVIQKWVETLRLCVFQTSCKILPRGISALVIVLLDFLRFYLPEA
jgi:hypothetical protein